MLLMDDTNEKAFSGASFPGTRGVFDRRGSAEANGILTEAGRTAALSAEGSLIAATFNLRRDMFFDFRNRWNARKEYAAEVIRQTGATVIGVQELSPAMRGDVTQLLREYSVVGAGRSKKNTSEHSDIIVKDTDAEIDYFNTFWLSKQPERRGSRAFSTIFPRICTVAEVNIKNLGRRIRVFNSHFDCISSLARNLGAEIILKYISELQKKERLPFILMGDFNAKPSDPLIQRLRVNAHGFPDIRLRDALFEYNYEKFGRMPKESRTFHFFKGKRIGQPIDYIFVSDEFYIHSAHVEAVSFEGKYPSDHYPVVASLSLLR